MNLAKLKELLPKYPWFPRGPLTDEESCTAGGTPAEIVAEVVAADDEGPREVLHVAEFYNEKDRDRALLWVNLAPELIAVVETAQTLSADLDGRERGDRMPYRTHMALDAALDALHAKLAQEQCP